MRRDLDAGLIVLGGRHHKAPARWFGGSTVHHAIRIIDIPVLVTTSPQKTAGRVLAAVDLSYASAPTLEMAARMAKLFGAALKILHVVEPLPFLPDPTLQIDAAEYARVTEQEFNGLASGVLKKQKAEREVVQGRATDLIEQVAADWKADVVVVGSHGKGWVDRVLLGSATQRLLNHLPASLLVVPVRAPKGRSTTLALSGESTKTK